MDVLFLPADRTLGHKVMLLRTDRKLSRAELACLATEGFRALGYPHRKVTLTDVGFLERDWQIFPPKKAAILTLLGLEDE